MLGKWERKLKQEIAVNFKLSFKLRTLVICKVWYIPGYAIYSKKGYPTNNYYPMNKAPAGVKYMHPISSP